MPALAITDFTNLCGLVKFYGSAHGAGIKPIIGADFHVQSEELGDELAQLTVLASNSETDAADFPRLSAWLRGRRPDHRSRLAD